MFLMLNMAGALTSYQSFLENGSTLRWDRAEEAFNIFPGSDPPGTSSPLPYGLREEARTPQTPEGPPSPSPSPGPGPSRAHATGEAQARVRHDSSRHPPPSAAILHHPAPFAVPRRPPAHIPPLPCRCRPYTFFLAPFLPPLVSRLFLPTAIVPARPPKGRPPLARDFTRARLARDPRRPRPPSRERGRGRGSAAPQGHRVPPPSGQRHWWAVCAVPSAGCGSAVAPSEQPAV